MTPDPAQIEQFLRWLGGPWRLVAFDPDTRAQEDHPSDDPAEAAEWAARTNARGWNCYYTPNPFRPGSETRDESNIAALTHLFVDIDPRAGEHLESEQARILALLTTQLPKGIPSPSVLVFSGGGWQAVWKLDEPLPLEGDDFERAKLYNLALVNDLGADRCQSLQHLMRLPGTINWPDERKRARGRVPAMAHTAQWTDDQYALTEFRQEQLPAKVDRGRVVVETVAVRRLTGADELDRWGVPDRVKAIIVKGEDPGDPGRYPSRSEAVCAVCCELVRRGVPDDTIYAVITDPDFAISASVLEAGDRYAIRQIERAHEIGVARELVELNDRHFVVENWGGKCRVMEEVRDAALGRTRLTGQSFADFVNRYCNRSVVVGQNAKGQDIEKPLGVWWKEHPRRRQFRRIEFLPGVEASPDVYNLWRGFAVRPAPGDCTLFLDHVRENVCGGDPALYEYLLSWMARGVQDPGSPGEVAVVLRGGRGVGKSFFATEYGALFGRHFLHVSNGKHLVGNFNAHLQDAAVVFADEAFYAGDRQHESVLKTLITEPTLAIESKGVNIEIAPNCISLIMASNSEWVVPAGPMERRFVVLDVAATHAQDTAYFGAIRRQMVEGGRAALLRMLLDRDLTGFEVRRAPRTAGLADQQERSLTPGDEWILTLLEHGALPLCPRGRPNIAYSNNITGAPGLYQDARERVPALRHASDRKLGMTLAAWGCANWSDGTRRGWEFPPLDDMRRAWDGRVGSRAWDAQADWITHPGGDA